MSPVSTLAVPAHPNRKYRHSLREISLVSLLTRGLRNEMVVTLLLCEAEISSRYWSESIGGMDRAKAYLEEEGEDVDEEHVVIRQNT